MVGDIERRRAVAVCDLRNREPPRTAPSGQLVGRHAARPHLLGSDRSDGCRRPANNFVWGSLPEPDMRGCHIAKEAHLRLDAEPRGDEIADLGDDEHRDGAGA